MLLNGLVMSAWWFRVAETGPGGVGRVTKQTVVINEDDDDRLGAKMIQAGKTPHIC